MDNIFKYNVRIDCLVVHEPEKVSHGENSKYEGKILLGEKVYEYKSPVYFSKFAIDMFETYKNSIALFVLDSSDMYEIDPILEDSYASRIAFKNSYYEYYLFSNDIKLISNIKMRLP